MQAYTTQGYVDLLCECGFDQVKFHPSMGESLDVCGGDFVVVTARKAEA